jgi:hypothetical protein
MMEHIQQPYVEAELSYRRERLQRSFAGGHQPHRSLTHWVRGALRNRRDPVRGASRYQLDGPLTRRNTVFDSYCITPAPHH